MKVAYSRVSSHKGQETGMETQIDILEKFGVDKMFVETGSGTTTQGRDKLKNVLNLFVKEMNLLLPELTDLRGVFLTFK